MKQLTQYIQEKLHVSKYKKEEPIKDFDDLMFKMKNQNLTDISKSNNINIGEFCIYQDNKFLLLCTHKYTEREIDYIYCIGFNKDDKYNVNINYIKFQDQDTYYGNPFQLNNVNKTVEYKDLGTIKHFISFFNKIFKHYEHEDIKNFNFDIVMDYIIRQLYLSLSK